jgi:hypothetical protein
MNRIQFRYRPAVYARWTDDELIAPFRIDWRSGGLAGISTNDVDEAEAWRRDRRTEGRAVIEHDALSRQFPQLRLSQREQLARDIENGRSNFSRIERIVIAGALRSGRSGGAAKVVLPSHLVSVAKAIKAGDLELDLCPMTSAEKALMRRYLRRN